MGTGEAKSLSLLELWLSVMGWQHHPLSDTWAIRVKKQLKKPQSLLDWMLRSKQLQSFPY